MTHPRHIKTLELDKVLNMLSDCATLGDSKVLAKELYPVSNIKEAEALMNQTNAAYVLLAKFGGPSFGAAENVDSALARAGAGGVLTMRELLKIGEVLRVIRSVYEWRFSQPGADSCLDIYFSSLCPNKTFENRIFTSILSEDEMADNASKELADIRRKIRNKSQGIREKLEGLIRSSHYQKFLQEAIITQRNGRFVVPVKNEYRSEVSGLVHDTSGSGATVFIEPMSVVELNNEIRVLTGKEKEEIERILTELSLAAGELADSIKHNFASLVELNLIFAKAHLAYKMKASLPILNTDGIIDLKKARHPLLNPDKVVATDIYLGKDFDTLVITGPNTGGKTVSIKTVGLLTLMACCGLMIPTSDNSSICVFDKVFADIGDEQSIEQSLSTFSSHMVNIADILREADCESLVLIDELGAGTDPVEGAALAIAILERLHINGAKIAATTHYAELKAYALDSPRVQNASCEFDVSTLKPTYRLLIGIPGRSNAFAISQRLGIDEMLIARANEFVSSENIRFENVVDSLEQSRLSMEAEKKAVEKLKLEYEEKLSEAERKLSEAENLRRDEYEKAQGEALKITEKARREANILLSQIETLKKEMKTTSDAAELLKKAKQAMKKGLNDIDTAVNPVTVSLYEDDSYVLPRPLKKGDIVLLTELGKEATVLSLPDKRGQVEVLSGALRMRVGENKLRLIEKKQQKQKTASVSRKGSLESAIAASGNTRCDLRGMTVDEAILTLDSFIDSMLMSNIGEFTVIHGKGTGALRAAVQKHLKSNKFVKSYRLGVYGEGENGVTIVTMK